MANTLETIIGHIEKYREVLKEYGCEPFLSDLLPLLHELKAFREAAPKTEDGQYVIPGKPVFNTLKRCDGSWTSIEKRETAVCVETLDCEMPWNDNFADCFSSEQAAIAAQNATTPVVN